MTKVEGEGKDAAAKLAAGALVVRVLPQSPAETAQVREGDRVMSLNGIAVKSSAHFRELIRAHKPAQEVKMTLRREGKDLEVKVKLTAAAEDIKNANLFPQQGDDGVERAVPGIVKFRSGTSSRARAVSPAANPAEEKDAVSLRDGNRLTGVFRGVTTEREWILGRDKQPDLELLESEISTLTFAHRDKTAAPESPTAAAQLFKVVTQLRDGSTLHGEALTMEDGAISLTFAEGRTVKIPRAHVQSMTLSDGDAPQIYEGPSSIAGWVSGRTTPLQWEFKDGVLRSKSTGPIGRNLGRLPDPIDLSFDVTFPRTLQNFALTLFSGGVGGIWNRGARAECESGTNLRQPLRWRPFEPIRCKHRGAKARTEHEARDSPVSHPRGPGERTRAHFRGGDQASRVEAFQGATRGP